jgi:hypothetical protein
MSVIFITDARVRTNAITANATANDTTTKYVAKGIALPTLNKYVSGKTYPTSVKSSPLRRILSDVE